MKALLIIILLLATVNVYCQDQLTTVILVRHAEKGVDQNGDPDLTEDGQKRARELMRILKDQPIDVIYSSPYKRTRQTVAPLALFKNKEIKEYNPSRMEEVIELIKGAKGQTILLSGHSNTTPAIINQILKINSFNELNESDYDNIYIVTFSEIGSGAVVQLEYGYDNEL
jgi:2,3-bisphosphoglycerate-dependent phosphoglycerate mutase